MLNSIHRAATHRAWLSALLALGMAQARAAAPVPPLPPPAPQTVTVASLALGMEAADWERQREQIAATLTQLRPDVVALQDVRQAPEMSNQACWLAARLDYSCSFITADPPSRGHRRGNALLSRRPVLADAVTLLHPFEMASTAGMVQLDVDGHPLNVYMTSLFRDDGHAAQDAAAIRAAQVQNLLRWIAATADAAPSLVLGDMAATTDAPELQALAKRYRTVRIADSDAARRGRVFVEAPLQALDATLLARPASDAGATGTGLLTTVALPPLPLPATTRR